MAAEIVKDAGIQMDVNVKVKFAVFVPAQMDNSGNSASTDNPVAGSCVNGSVPGRKSGLGGNGSNSAGGTQTQQKRKTDIYPKQVTLYNLRLAMEPSWKEDKESVK
mmetsp:Transcript_48001/g.145022  ORF Transcript_48001/g.145022 Transcript_48001/m.145022 type:complete len:106 (-) Transcript_48001:260-577(-)